VLGAAETTTSHRSDFTAVPELYRGVFRFTPAAAATARAREETERRKRIVPSAIARSASWQELITKPRAS
jgi:hypothetical protein